MTKDKVRVKKGRPYYHPFFGGYVVDYYVNGVNGFKVFDTHKEGIEWLKTKFPEWFAKNYISPKK